MASDLPPEHAFLLVRKFGWWWPYRYDRRKERDIVRHLTDKAAEEGHPISGVLFVGERHQASIDPLAVKLNSHGRPDDGTYERRRRLALEARDRAEATG